MTIAVIIPEVRARARARPTTRASEHFYRRNYTSVGALSSSRPTGFRGNRIVSVPSDRAFANSRETTFTHARENNNNNNNKLLWKFNQTFRDFFDLSPVRRKLRRNAYCAFVRYRVAFHEYTRLRRFRSSRSRIPGRCRVCVSTIETTHLASSTYSWSTDGDRSEHVQTWPNTVYRNSSSGRIRVEFFFFSSKYDYTVILGGRGCIPLRSNFSKERLRKRKEKLGQRVSRVRARYILLKLSRYFDLSFS